MASHPTKTQMTGMNISIVDQEHSLTQKIRVLNQENSPTWTEYSRLKIIAQRLKELNEELDLL